MPKKEPKRNWVIDSNAFSRLLEWLDNGQDSDGQNYLEIRRRLVAYFDRKNCLTSDEFADETLNRVARRIEEEEKIETETPAKYCYTTARFVFLESLRGAEKFNVSLDYLQKKKPDLIEKPNDDDEKANKEKMLDCLDKCVDKLKAENRKLILGYYFGEERVKIENRRGLAQKLGFSVNALSIRACRLRDKLEVCVGQCASES